jgi:3-methylcrotonyl-CoA carboxylase alpha subunit
MLAKLIAWGEDRSHAREALLRALSACEVTGVATNIAFLERVVAHEAFASGRVDTGLIDAHRDELLEPATDVPAPALIAAAVAEYRTVEASTRAMAAASADRWSPWHATDAWWNGTATHHLSLAFDDGTREHAVSVKPRADGSLDVRGEAFGETIAADEAPATVVRDGDARHVFAPGMRVRLAYVDPFAHANAVVEHGGRLTAPMSGTIVAVMVQPGDAVEKGAALVVLEAMKMEHAIVAPTAGRVGAVHFAVGDRVVEGADVVDLDDEQAKPMRSER